MEKSKNEPTDNQMRAISTAFGSYTMALNKQGIPDAVIFYLTFLLVGSLVSKQVGQKKFQELCRQADSLGGMLEEALRDIMNTSPSLD